MNQVRLWTPPDRSEDGKSTLDLAVLISSSYMQQYFNSQYPYSVLGRLSQSLTL